MTFNEFILIVNICPMCGKEMTCDLSVCGGIYLICYTQHDFYYESYQINFSNITDINAISIILNNYNIVWQNDLKIFSIKDELGKVLIKKSYVNKTSIDWLIPNKTLINKAQPLLSLI